MSGATKKVDLAELRKALRELGVKDLEGQWGERQLATYAAKLEVGATFTAHVETERLGRCYNRYTSLIVAGTEADATKGNEGNYRVVARGQHPLLGHWIKTSHEVDSSD